MKRTIVYLWLLFYLFIQVKPCFPIVQDILAHHFWKTKHIAEKHHHGHHHLHHELTLEAGDHDHSKPIEKNHAQKTGEELSEHLQCMSTFCFVNQGQVISHLFSYTNHHMSVMLKQETPPPKF